MTSVLASVEGDNWLELTAEPLATERALAWAAALTEPEPDRLARGFRPGGARGGIAGAILNNRYVAKALDAVSQGVKRGEGGRRIVSEVYYAGGNL